MIKWKYFPQWNMCCTKIRLISRDARVELYKLSNNRYRVEWDSTMWRTKEFTAKDWKEAQATAIALIKRFIFESADYWTELVEFISKEGLKSHNL